MSCQQKEKEIICLLKAYTILAPPTVQGHLGAFKMIKEMPRVKNQKEQVDKMTPTCCFLNHLVIFPSQRVCQDDTLSHTFSFVGKW